MNRSAPAGSEKSLGGEGARDDHPLTDDGTVEKIDEETPSLARKLIDGYQSLFLRAFPTKSFAN